jgi:lysophospholipase L1-like esterase
MRSSVRQRLLAASFGTLVAFGAAEVTVRLTLPPVDLASRSGVSQEFDGMSSWAQLDAFCAYRPRSGGYLGRKTVSSDGWFSTPELGSKPVDGLRLAFLGGSSTAGTVPLLEDEQTWPWLCAELVRAGVDRPVDFVNAAMPGFSTFESYGRLWSRVRFTRPDVVVVNHAWNDMYYFRNADRAARWRVRKDGSWGFEERTAVLEHRIRPHWIDPWIEWSSVLCRIRRRFFAEPLEGEVGAQRELADDFDADAVEVFRQNLRLLVAAQSALGFELFVVKQPTLIIPGLAEELRARCGYHLHGFDHDAHVRAFEACYRVIDEEVPPERVIDLTDLSGDPVLLHDHVHPTPEGARAIAERVATHLLARLAP